MILAERVYGLDGSEAIDGRVQIFVFIILEYTYCKVKKWVKE